MCLIATTITSALIAGRIQRQKRSTRPGFETSRNCRSSTNMEINAAAARSLRLSMQIGDYVVTRIHAITLKRSSSTSPVRTTFVKAGVLTASPKTRNSIADAAANRPNTETRRFPSFDSTKDLNRERMATSNKQDAETPTNHRMHGSGGGQRILKLKSTPAAP